MESLTKDRMAKPNEVKGRVGVRNVWTNDGKNIFKDEKNPSILPL